RHYLVALQMLDLMDSQPAAERGALLLAFGEAQTRAGDAIGAQAAFEQSAGASRAESGSASNMAPTIACWFSCSRIRWWRWDRTTARCGRGCWRGWPRRSPPSGMS